MKFPPPDGIGPVKKPMVLAAAAIEGRRRTRRRRGKRMSAPDTDEEENYRGGGKEGESQVFFSFLSFFLKNLNRPVRSDGITVFLSFFEVCLPVRPRNR